jgi:outer membrane protein assembly factor BamB
MDSELLIQRVRATLVRGMTDEHVAALRRALDSCPGVRQALLDELESRDEAAASSATDFEDADEFMARVEQLVAERHGQGFSWSAAVASFIGLVLLLAGAIGVFHRVTKSANVPDTPGQRIAADRDAADQKDSAKGAAKPESAPVPSTTLQEPPGGDGVARSDAEPAATKEDPEEAIAQQDATSSTFEIDWRLYDDATPEQRSIWGKNVRDVLRPVGNSPLRSQAGKKHYDLNGTYSLKPPAADGGAIRLRFSNLQQFQLTLSNDLERVRVQWVDDWLLRGLQAGAGEATGSSPSEVGALLMPAASQPFRATVDDEGQWKGFGTGTLDVRYESGNIVFAHGDIVILRLPMGRPPTSAVLVANARLELAESLKLKPLRQVRQTTESGSSASRQKPPPSTLDWQIAPRQAADVVQIKQLDNGGIQISSEQELAADVRVGVHVPVHGGTEVVLKLSDASAAIGFFYESALDGRVQRYFVVGEPGQQALCSAPIGQADVRGQLDAGFVVERTFYARVRFALDHECVHFSRDGENWVLLSAREPTGIARPSAGGRVGVCAAKGGGPKRIRVEQFMIRRRTALTSLSDPALLSKVPGAASVENSSAAWQRYIGHAIAARPSGVAKGKWWMACLARVVAADAPPQVRREAAVRLVETAVAEGVGSELVLDALAELPLVVVVREGDAAYGSWNRLASIYDRLAEREWQAGRAEQLEKLWTAVLARSFGLGGRGPLTPDDLLPHDLIRLHLYELRDRGDFEQLGLVALQVHFLGRFSTLQKPSDIRASPTQLLSLWMFSQAAKRLDGVPRLRGDLGRLDILPPHPLAVEPNRDALTAVSEIDAAIRNKEYRHACRLMTSPSLPVDLMPADDTGQLLQSTVTLLQHRFETHPELARTLRDEFGKVGIVRVRQALDRRQFDQLPLLVAQFHGTEAARQALRALADRDLSMGDFASAASRYSELLRDAAPDELSVLDAKRRMALALTGELADGSPRGPLQFGPLAVPGDEFQEMLKAIVAERGGAAIDRGTSTSLAPGPGKMRLAPIANIEFSDRLSLAARRWAAWSHAGDYLVAHVFDRLIVVNPKDRRVWQRSEKRAPDSNPKSAPAAPLVVGNRLIVPFNYEKLRALTCFDVNSGDVQWQKNLDDGVLGIPLQVGPWVYVPTVQRQPPHFLDVRLRRIAPDSGESDFARHLARFRDDATVYQVGPPVQAGQAIVFCAGATVVCADMPYRLRWIRRLPWVPPAAGSSSSEYFQLSNLVTQGDRIMVSCPGSPYLTCLDSQTGRTIWARLQPDVRRITPCRGNRVIAIGRDWIEAVDSRNGARIWHTSTTAHPESVMLAASGSIVAISRLGDQRREEDRRSGTHRIDWFSVEDGRVISTLRLDVRGSALGEPGSISSDGSVIMLLAGLDGDRPIGRLVALEPSDQSANSP